MGRLAQWWSRVTASPSRPSARQAPPEARFTQIGTNYEGAPITTAPAWSAPNPYEGFDPRAPSSTSDDPTSTGTPPWGTAGASTPSSQPSTIGSTAPSATVAPAVPSSQPGNPYLTGAAAGPPGVHHSSRTIRGSLAVGVAIVIVVVVAGIIYGAVSRLGDDSGGGLGSAPELEESWQVDSYDHSDYGTFDRADGSLPGTILPTSHGLVAMIEPSTVDAVLLSVDPESGSVQWSVPMPEARCTTPDPDTLLCLTRQGGSTFEIVTIAVDTGEVVGDPVPTAISHVPVLLLPLGSDHLVTLSVDKELTALDLQGTTVWEQSVDSPDLDTSYLQADVAHYDSSLVLYFGWLQGTLLITAEGATQHACDGVAVTPEAWMCQGEAEAVGLAPDGTELWREDWRDYYLIDRYEHIAPVMLVDNWDGTVSSVDPLTGDHGAAIDLGDDSSFNFLGDAEHPFVLSDDQIFLLDAGLSRAEWSAPITDGYLNIAGGGVVGDTLVIDGEHSWGLDLADGTQLWERDFLAYDTYVIGDAFYGVRISELVRYELP